MNRQFQSLLFTSAFLNSQSTSHDVTLISKYWNQKCIGSFTRLFSPLVLGTRLYGIGKLVSSFLPCVMFSWEQKSDEK